MPDAIELADHWDFGPCGHIVVELESGATVDIARPGTIEEGCPPEAPTPFLLGQSNDLTAMADHGQRWARSDAPVVFVAHVDGQLRLGAARPLNGCRTHTFDTGEGAHKEGEQFVLTSGLVLATAADFAVPRYPPDPYPLRSGDKMCLNDRGEVTSFEVWIPY